MFDLELETVKLVEEMIKERVERSEIVTLYDLIINLWAGSEMPLKVAWNLVKVCVDDYGLNMALVDGQGVMDDLHRIYDEARQIFYGSRGLVDAIVENWDDDIVIWGLPHGRREFSSASAKREIRDKLLACDWVILNPEPRPVVEWVDIMDSIGEPYEPSEPTWLDSGEYEYTLIADISGDKKIQYRHKPSGSFVSQASVEADLGYLPHMVSEESFWGNCS